MIITAHAIEDDVFGELFCQMFELRAQQFKHRRKWSVEVKNNLERDRFDDLNPLYVLATSDSGRLLGSLRLLPTTGPHMLSDVFADVMGDAEIVRNPLVIESSRFCVDTCACKEFGPAGVNQVTVQLLQALFQTAQAAGMTHVISVYDVFMERILRRAGCNFERLGPIVEYDGLKTVGGLCEVSDAVIQKISAQLPFVYKAVA